MSGIFCIMVFGLQRGVFCCGFVLFWSDVRKTCKHDSAWQR